MTPTFATPSTPAALARHLGNGVGLSAPDMPDPAWDTALAALTRLRELKDDWDGQGAPVPVAGAIDTAVALAGVLRREGIRSPTHALAGVNGTVFLEWQTPAVFCELECVGPGEAECRVLNKEDRTTETATVRLDD